MEPQRKPLQKIRVNGIDLSVVQQHPLFRARGVIENRRAESVQHESVQAPSQLAIHFLAARAVYRRFLSLPFPFSFPFPVSLLPWSFSSCCVVRLPETSLFLPPFAFPGPCLCASMTRKVSRLTMRRDRERWPGRSSGARLSAAGRPL